MDLVVMIENGLGEERLRKLKKNEDDYQNFWLGVLEHRKDSDGRDPIPYLICCGYGAIRNARLSENTKRKMKVKDGKMKSYRSDGETVVRLVSATKENGEQWDFESKDRDKNFELDIERFLSTLHGNERYVARRWLLDRADLMYDNHCKQIALEMNCSAPYVARVKKSIRNKWKNWY